jgi:hypothetical protein
MPRFVVYEVWTRHQIVEAENETAALEQDYSPSHIDWSGMSLCNWHAVAIDEPVASDRARRVAVQRETSDAPQIQNDDHVGEDMTRGMTLSERASDRRPVRLIGSGERRGRA